MVGTNVDVRSKSVYRSFETFLRVSGFIVVSNVLFDVNIIVGTSSCWWMPYAKIVISLVGL